MKNFQNFLNEQASVSTFLVTKRVKQLVKILPVVQEAERLMTDDSVKQCRKSSKSIAFNSACNAFEKKVVSRRIQEVIKQYSFLDVPISTPIEMQNALTKLEALHYGGAPPWEGDLVDVSWYVNHDIPDPDKSKALRALYDSISGLGVILGDLDFDTQDLMGLLIKKLEPKSSL